jgi:hypothetical protein
VCFADCCRPIPATVHSLCISGSGGSPRLPHSLQSCQQRARSPRSTAVDSESQRHMRHVAIQGLKEGTGPRREKRLLLSKQGTVEEHILQFVQANRDLFASVVHAEVEGLPFTIRIAGQSTQRVQICLCKLPRSRRRCSFGQCLSLQ